MLIIHDFVLSLGTFVNNVAMIILRSSLQFNVSQPFLEFLSLFELWLLDPFVMNQVVRSRYESEKLSH